MSRYFALSHFEKKLLIKMVEKIAKVAICLSNLLPYLILEFAFGN